MSDNTGLNAGYESMRSDPQEGMGGGVGAHGSGVAGGYEGSQQNAQTQAQGQGQAAGTSAEKQDWLDKGIIGIGKKFGLNVVRATSRYGTSQRS